MTVSSFIVLHSCKKEESYYNEFDNFPEVYIKVSYHNTYGNICFAGTPVKLRPETVHYNFGDLSENHAFDYSWDFGDGNKSTNEKVEHTFDKPGSYNVNLSIYNNRDSLLIDTIIDVSIYPRIVEQNSTTENGKYIYQTDNRRYTIVYTYNEGTSSDDWYAISYNDTTIVSKTDLNLELYPEVKELIHNQSGNFVMLTDTWYKEFTSNGSLINKEQVWGEYCSIKNYNEGYLLVGSDEQIVRIKELNASGLSISENVSSQHVDGFVRMGISQTGNNEIFLHYIDTNYSNYTDRHTVLRRIKIDSSVVWQKEYEFESTRYIYKLSDGYLLSGVIVGEYTGEIDQVFTKIDNGGNVIWQFITPLNSLYINYIHSPGMNIFESNNEIIIFFDNMRCIKLDNNGQLIYEAYFGWNYDVFNYAIKNENDNYLILGSRQYDTEKNEATSDYNKRDLIIIEIDENFKPIR
ncbi:MAG: PKD domain-containing protein [Bacteroidales bacterium]|nr:PKD domain-containing protein [Bacteroidales bacterium]